MQSRTRVSNFLAVAALAVTGVCIGATGASAGTITTVLYSTQQDFAGWTGNAGPTPVTAGTTVSTVAIVATPTEGGTTNGIADPTPASVGQTGTAGALQITLPNGMNTAAVSNYQVVASSPGLNGNTAVINALDSGGNLTLDFTYPTGGQYFNAPRFLINYPGQYQQLTGTASATADANGFYTDTISLAGLPNVAAAEAASQTAHGYGYLNFGIIFNADVPAGGVSTISNIAITSTTTPEPASIAMLGIGGAAILLIGRRRRMA